MLSFLSSQSRETQTKAKADLEICRYLHAAAEGDFFNFKSYLEAGIDANSKLTAETTIDISKVLPATVVTKEKTAMELAIENARADIVHYLLYIHSTTPDLNQATSRGSLFSVVLESIAQDRNALDHIAIMLLDKKVTLDDIAICQAAHKGLRNTVAKLLTADADPNQTIPAIDSATKGLYPITALGYAIANNDLVLTNILLEYKASLEICTNHKTLVSTFELAMQSASFELIMLLYSNLTDNQKDSLSHYDLLHMALKQANIYQNDLILQLAHLLSDADLARTDHKDGALLFVAAKIGCVELVQHLLNRGVNPQQMNQYRQTAVFYALPPMTDDFHPLNKIEACNYFPEQSPVADTPNTGAVITLLASRGVDLNYRPHLGKMYPPVVHAIINHLSYAFAALIEQNACLTHANFDLVYLNNKSPVSDHLFKLASNLSAHEDAFMPANCPLGRFNKVIYKIENISGSLITIAALSNNEAALNFLLSTDKLTLKQKHAFVNQIIVPKTGLTLLMFLASMRGDYYRKIILALIKFGVNTYAKSKQKLTAFEYAYYAGNDNIAAIISSHEGVQLTYATLRMTKRTLGRLLTFQFDEPKIKQQALVSQTSVISAQITTSQETAIVPYNPNSMAIVQYRSLNMNL